MDTDKTVKNKFIHDLSSILSGCTSEFTPTIQYLNCILNEVKEFEEERFHNKKLLNNLKHLVWKYYRVYKLKEFILYFFERIAVEKNTVDKNTFKTVEMINAVFCWEITNSGNNNEKKYNQKYYSERVLKNTIEKKYVSDSKKSLSDKSLLLRAILGHEEFILTIDGETILVEPDIRRSSKQNDIINQLLIEEYNKQWDSKYLDESEKPMKEISLKTVLEQNMNDLNSGQNLIHSFASTSSGTIQLDHVLPRFYVKKIIEELCDELNQIEKESDRIKLIDNQINFLIPLMFGCVVTRDENTQLSHYSVNLANLYFEQLNDCVKENLENEFAQDYKGKIKSFPDLFCDEEQGKKARKHIASELFFQFWRAIDWENESSKKTTRKAILRMLFNNYEHSDLVDQPNEDESTNIQLWAVSNKGLVKVSEFMEEEDEYEKEIESLKNLFSDTI
jgi:hypothetical protein